MDENGNVYLVANDDGEGDDDEYGNEDGMDE
jgi:hypothetical protein